ncbi:MULTISPECIES: hypothetical protein [Methanobacterium]|uniref:Uncharacterized protein n=1 Tax=Methanobacterium bryantii TaxID=2161 RepID=A0A2A2H9W2_METBR|nr:MULTISPECIES: hypothetical protein [Methanobacterium]OEC86980.1 hypothetical protein A9507_08745 [Methanobacterium sp. A39]PAV06043.1 hypothetical protein ASJ80_14490 [Methanobacterium bryantii]
MVLIAQNHLQFIIEVGLMTLVGVMLLLNIVPISLSMVLFVMLILAVGITLLFGFDAVSLLLLHNAYEFTHFFGPIAIFAVVTLLAALPMMKEVGIRVANLRIFVFLLIGLIAITGSIVHRIFFPVLIIGILIGLFIISKSFRQKSIFTVKRVIAVIGVMIIGFGASELLSEILHMSVLSPLLRVTRLEEQALPSLTLVLKNAALIGHVQGSSYWGILDTGFASGYISLPYQLITSLTLPFPIFYGVLSNKKDVIDYFLPGIFGYTYDFGYIALICLLLGCIAVIFIGFKILAVYREKREIGNRNYLGREALLIGALAAFSIQAVEGLFFSNRDINGKALVTFMFLGSMVLGHILMVKKR